MTTPLPRISIIVPNFNGQETLARTLQSLIDQHYPDLEILVVDGGSTDNSLQIIRAHEPHLAWWCSEKDQGQSDAINKGFARATGDVVNWLCSDDYLLPGALARVGQVFAEHDDVDVVTGRIHTEFLPEHRREDSTLLEPWHIELLPAANTIPQMATFYRRRLLNRPGPLRTDLHLVMDFELWNYFQTQGARWHILPDFLAVFVMGQTNKSATLHDKVIAEQESVYRQYRPQRISLAWWYRRFMLPVQLWRGRTPKGFKKIAGLTCKLLFVAMLGPFYGYRRTLWMNLGTLG